MLIIAIIATFSFVITLLKRELGVALIFLGILFPMPTGRVTSDVGITIGVFVAGLVSSIYKKKVYSPALKLLVASLIGFIALGCLSQIHSFKILPEAVSKQSFISFKWFIFNFLVLFGTLFNISSYQEFNKFMTFLKVIFITILLVGLAQILKTLHFLPIGEYIFFAEEGKVGVHSIFTYGGPNTLITFILMTFPLIFVHNLNKKGKLLDFENLFLLLLSSLIFLFTFSRAGYLAVTIYLIFVLLPITFIKGKYLGKYIFSLLALIMMGYISLFLLFKGLKSAFPSSDFLQQETWECYLTDKKHKIKQVISLNSSVFKGSLFLYLSGGKGGRYKLLVKVDGNNVYTFNNGLENDPKWYKIPLPEKIIRKAQKIVVTLELEGVADDKDNFVRIYGGNDSGREKVESFFFDGFKWINRDLSPNTPGQQEGIYYIFFKSETDNIEETKSTGHSVGSWKSIITDVRYKIKQTIWLKDEVLEKALYLEMAGGRGDTYSIRVIAEGEEIRKYHKLDLIPRWYRIELPDRLLQGKNRIEVLVEGVGKLDSQNNWFLVKGSDPGGISGLHSYFYDGISWQDYDLSPDDGLQSGVYHIFLGQNRNKIYMQRGLDSWDCYITNKEYKIKQIISLKDKEPKGNLYLELMGGVRGDYRARVKVEGEILKEYSQLGLIPRWYQIEVPDRLLRGKKRIEVIVEGLGKLDTQTNWFLVKGSDPGEASGLQSYFYDGVSWQDYDLSPDDGLQSGAYHIILDSINFSNYLPNAASQADWDMYLAEDTHKVLQRISLPPDTREGNLFLLLSGTQGKDYSVRILVNDTVIKTFTDGMSTHPIWYKIPVPRNLSKEKSTIDVKLEALGSLGPIINWVKIYGNNNSPCKNVKSFLYDGNRWIDFDLSIRQGIQKGCYHIYYEPNPQFYSQYGNPQGTEIYYNNNKIMQIFYKYKEFFTKSNPGYVAINMGGVGTGKDYNVIATANGTVLKKFKGGLPIGAKWYKFKLPPLSSIKEDNLKIIVQIEKENQRDFKALVQNSVFVGGGLSYTGEYIDSYADFTGKFEKVGLSPIVEMPKKIYRIVLISEDGEVTYPHYKNLDINTYSDYELDKFNNLKSLPKFIKIGLAVLYKYFLKEDQSNHDRLILWSLCIDIIKDHPLLGVGYYTFDKVYPVYYKRYQDLLPIIYTHPHNDFLAMGVSLGLGGMFFFCLWYILPLSVSIKLLSDSSKKSSFYYGLALSGTHFTLPILSLFYMNFADQRLYGSYWVIVGLTYVIGLLHNDKIEE